MKSKARSASALVILLLLCGGRLMAHGMTGVSSTPKLPTSDDPVVFDVKGYFSDFCERTIISGEALVAGGAVTLWIVAQGSPDGLGCPLPAIRDFETSIAAGHLPFGSYRVDIRLEVHEYGKVYTEDFPKVLDLQVQAGMEEAIQRVEVNPPRPIGGEPVSLTALATVVECIAEVRATTAAVEGNRIRLTMVVNVPPVDCPGRPQALEGTADALALSPGDYTVDAELVFIFQDPFWSAQFPSLRTFTVGGAALAAFKRGDCNSDGNRDLSDALKALTHLFLGDDITCSKACDSNGDGALDISDPAYVLNYLFLNGPILPEPFAACGGDPSGLSCIASTAGCP